MIGFAGTVVLLLMVTVEARVGNSNETTSHCTETKECLLYTPVCKGDGYEVRHYEASKWVSTDIKTYFSELAKLQGFKKLFNYISGENEAGTKIDMTAPVILKVKENRGFFELPVYTLSFLLPSAYQQNAPKPTDSTVYLTDLPDMDVYVKSYGGWGITITFSYFSYSLKQSLDKVQARYNKDYSYDVGYNSPSQLTNRHNEVWYVVEGKPVCSASQ